MNNEKCSNRHECTCPYTSCANHGKCCNCVAYHRGNNEMPMCFKKQKMKKERLYDVALFLIFLIYLSFIAWCILFKYVTPTEVFNPNRYFSRTINITPFNDLKNGYFNFADIYGNIFLFIPLGFYLSLYRGRKPLSNLILACFLSISFECLQYIFGIGASDITDIILNTFGTLVGMFLYIIFKLIFKDREKIKKFSVIIGSVCAVFIAFMVILVFKYNP